jgi:hypothetical protein
MRRPTGIAGAQGRARATATGNSNSNSKINSQGERSSGLSGSGRSHLPRVEKCTPAMNLNGARGNRLHPLNPHHRS